MEDGNVKEIVQTIIHLSTKKIMWSSYHASIRELDPRNICQIVVAFLEIKSNER